MTDAELIARLRESLKRGWIISPSEIEYVVNRLEQLSINSVDDETETDPHGTYR